MVKHSRTPWSYSNATIYANEFPGYGSDVVAKCESLAGFYNHSETNRANAHFIVQAVNNYEAARRDNRALAAENERLKGFIRSARDQHLGCGGRLPPAEVLDTVHAILDAALTPNQEATHG